MKTRKLEAVKTSSVVQAELIELRAKVSLAFRPGSPIDRLTLFAGRQSQINDITNAVLQTGQHVILFGERGVGKTSLARVLIEILSITGQTFLNSGTINCDGTDDFTSLWHKIFRELSVEITFRQAGFSDIADRQIQTITDWLPKEQVKPDDIRFALSRMPGSVIITLDEIDRLRKGEVTILLADTIKNLSDHAMDVTLILVGVADAVDDLIEGHKSVERALVQVPMPRMSAQELGQIIDKGMQHTGMSIEENARDKIIRLSQGLPHYTHLLGLHTAMQAVQNKRKRIKETDVQSATHNAVQKSHSLLSDYNTATTSPQRGNLYEEVLLGCAMAPADELGYFSAAGVAKPLSAILKKKYDVPSFARHLKEFSSEKRGFILKRTGEKRRYRYRFVNPLMQPFVMIHGLSSGLLTDELLLITKSRF